jgi:hypothetical protein
MRFKKDITIVDGHLSGTLDQDTVTAKRKAHDLSVSFEE